MLFLSWIALSLTVTRRIIRVWVQGSILALTIQNWYVVGGHNLLSPSLPLSLSSFYLCLLLLIFPVQYVPIDPLNSRVSCGKSMYSNLQKNQMPFCKQTWQWKIHHLVPCSEQFFHSKLHIQIRWFQTHDFPISSQAPATQHASDHGLCSCPCADASRDWSQMPLVGMTAGWTWWQVYVHIYMFIYIYIYVYIIICIDIYACVCAFTY